MFLLLVLLQRDPTVRKGADIRRLIKRYLKMWDTCQYDSLLYEAEHCNSQLHVKGGGKIADSNHSIRLFTCLILCVKLREAVMLQAEPLLYGMHADFGPGTAVFYLIPTWLLHVTVEYV